MVLSENSVFEREKKNKKKKTKPNRARYHKNSRRWSDRNKTFSYVFSPQMEAGALGVERIYKAGAERVNFDSIQNFF